MYLKGSININFQLTGDHFEPERITDKMGIKPTHSWNRPDWSNCIKVQPLGQYSLWEISIDEQGENIDIHEIIERLMDKLFDKVEAINELKVQYNLDSVLGITISTRLSENITPSVLFSLNFNIIEFLYKTKTRTECGFMSLDYIRFPA